VKETELFEDGLRRDALDLGLGVMRRRGRRVDLSLVEDVRDSALESCHMTLRSSSDKTSRVDHDPSGVGPSGQAARVGRSGVPAPFEDVGNRVQVGSNRMAFRFANSPHIHDWFRLVL